MKLDWDKVIKHGIFAMLFVSLLVFTMNENRARENEYRVIINNQISANEKFADLIKLDLTRIKEDLQDRR